MNKTEIVLWFKKYANFDIVIRDKYVRKLSCLIDLSIKRFLDDKLAANWLLNPNPLIFNIAPIDFINGNFDRLIQILKAK